ncbi:MAG: c-type cytochrome [Pikeienuella sp.]
MSLSTSAPALIAVALTLGLTVAPPAIAEEDTPGAREYQRSCLSCHGVGGRGDGPLSELMTVEVPDLTGIARRHDGKFPVQELFAIIDGRTGIRGHGYPMPVWGARYKAEAGDRYGPSGIGAEDVVRARILELVYYLHSIQQ